MIRKWVKMYADLETVTHDDKDQQYTEAWSSCILCPEVSSEPIIHHNLASTWDFLKKTPGNLLIYYHNLKFDGMFWMDFFIRHCSRLKPAYIKDADGNVTGFKPMHKLWNGEFIYNINDKGQWYSITIKLHKRYIIFRDSLKLLPFALKKLGEDFKTEHQKLDMEYVGNRYAGCRITKEEEDYIKNDVYVLKEALEIMFNEGHDKITIGSCCLSEFKFIFGKEEYDGIFPNLYEIPVPQDYFARDSRFGYTAGTYILKGYKGAWCFVNPLYQGRKIEGGFTLDVNSLYPSVMHSKSGNYYPIGKPTFFKGDLPECCLDGSKYYYVRFRCAFTLKPGYLPFVQIKGDFRYRATEHLLTSDLNIKGEYYGWKILDDGTKMRHTVELTMCKDEYELFLEHYNVDHFEILDGCWFYQGQGMFDEYIDKYMEIKATSSGSRRAIAKLFLNNLYGKFATSPDMSFKILVMGDDNVLHYRTIPAVGKTPGYIAVGAAITAKAKCFTIRAAQANIKYFCYADTDSLHLNCRPEDVKGVILNPTDLCTWKNEGEWEEGYFIRQKTYLEKGNKDGKPVYTLKCAGMPDRSKTLFLSAVTGKRPEFKLTELEENYIKHSKTLGDFNHDLTVPGKLYSKIVRGGIILYNDLYTMT